MEPLTLDELDRESAAFDRAVAASADIDRFCSSTDWQLPAARALMVDDGRPRTAWVRRGRAGFAAFARARHPVGFVLEPLEAMWALGCPLAGEDSLALAHELAEELTQNPCILLISGLERASKRFDSVLRALGPRFHLRLGPPARRFVASLDGGVDGFLARRSANLRRGIVRALKRARERGVTFESVKCDENNVLEMYTRLLKIEERSWKGQEGVGLQGSGMVEFYRAMVPRLARRGALELMFARADGRDVAYILGGIFGAVYRGLQFSFEAGLEDCALGNLCQYHQVRRLAETRPEIARYDLGAEVEYKRRWGEIVHETHSIIAYPR